MELFAKDMLVASEMERREALGQSHEQVREDLKKEGIITGHDFDFDRGQKLADQINPVLAKMLLLDLARKRKADKEGE